MAKVTVDGIEVTVPDSANVLEACRAAGVDVPHFCYHPRLHVVGQCRMCMVEIEGMPKIQASCTVPVRDGMKVLASSEKALAARNATMEFLLINHPLDCPICDQAGECKLQDNAVSAGLPVSRTSEPRRQYPGYDRTDIGPHVIADMTRCIQCTRCIRFCEEIAGTSELSFIERGGHTIVWTHEGRLLDNEWSACAADVCPVGALTVKEFRFRKRVWWLDKARSVCDGCEIGCNISIEHRDRIVYRFLPRVNPAVNDFWMCDYGRFRAEDLNTQDFLRPIVKGAETNWGVALDAVKAHVDEALAKKGKESVLVIGSAKLSTEEAYLLTSLFARKLGVSSLEFEADTGPVRRIKNPQAPGNENGWLRGVEAAPNSRGVEAAGLERAGKGSAIERLLSGKLTPAVIYIADADFGARAQDPDFVKAVRKAGVVVVQARKKAPLTEIADVILPVAPLSGSEGTFVNVQGRIQGFEVAIVPPPAVRSGLEVLLHLGRRWDLFNTKWTGRDVYEQLKQEIAIYRDAGQDWESVAGLAPPAAPASAYDSLWDPASIPASIEGRSG